MKISKFIMSVIFLVLFNGCNSMGVYFIDRANDLADCIKISIGFYAIGAEAHCRITDAVVCGVGLGSSMYIEYNRREFYQEVASVHIGFPIPLDLAASDFKTKFPCTYYGLVGDKDIFLCPIGHGIKSIKGGYEVRSIIFWPMSIEMEPKYTGEEYRNLPDNHVARSPFTGNILHSFDIEVGASAGLLLGLSAGIGFSPGEFTDFILGWFGFDIANDDTFTNNRSGN